MEKSPCTAAAADTAAVSDETPCTSKSSKTASDDVIRTVPISEIRHAVNRVIADRKREIWDEMRIRIENRRKDWDAEVEKMRRDFFHLKPANGSSTWKEFPGGGGEEAGDSRLKSMVSEAEGKFLVSFEVSSFQPGEISVRTEDQKLIVHALHEEKSPDGKRTIIREFNRQIDIPPHVQPEAMRCTLTRDGMLQVEGVAGRKSSTDGGGQWTGSPLREDVTAGNSPLNNNNDPVKFAIKVDIGKDFGPEDLEVKTVDRKVVVTARRQVLGSGKTSSKEFHREFELPATIDPITVTASMTEQGLLLIEAPFIS